MIFQRYFIAGLVVAIVSSVIGGLYASFFNAQLFDFSSILPIWKISAVYFSISLIATGLYFLLLHFFSKFGLILFNSMFVIAAVSSVMIPITAKIENVEFTEFYPIFAIPLHLVFSVVFLAISPLIIKNK
jgi:hypothetical protein